MVPGIFYINGKESIPILAKPLDLRSIVYTSTTKIVNLQIEGENGSVECFLKQASFHPVTDKLIHFDLMGIISGKTISVDIPIVLKGQAKGVREGGMLLHVHHKLLVECLPKDLPDAVEIDVTELTIGKSVHIKDVLVPDVKFHLSPDTVLVSVVMPRVSKEDAKLAATADAAAATAAATAAAAATPAPVAAKGKK